MISSTSVISAGLYSPSGGANTSAFQVFSVALCTSRLRTTAKPTASGFLSFLTTTPALLLASNWIQTGSPCRFQSPSIVPAKSCVEKTKNIDQCINLLVIGGSQGAKIFDMYIKTAIIELSKKYNLKIYQQTDLINFENLKKFYKDNKINHELFDFNEEISSLMSKANICITRAGASTLAELVFLNLPFVAIPLPTSKDNHQFENAFFYKEIGCNWILNQNEINDETIINKLVNIIDNKDEYLAKKINMKNFSYQNTWNNINQKIISVINENRISKN